MPVAIKPLPPIELLQQHLIYEPDTGLLRWKRRRGRESGSLAGSAMADGYIGIKVFGGRYKAHRIAWALVTGADAPSQIDHVDGDGTNNRWSNLRLASHGQNCMNRGAAPSNTSGFKGVSFDKSRGRWIAMIGLGGKQKNLGRFDTIEAAHAAYRAAAEKLHGPFARFD